MFLRIVADSFSRRPRHKLLTGAALALGMAVATAALSVSLDVGDRLASEFRSLGANLLVTPQADSLPLEIGGVDYRPVNAGAYLPEADVPKLKTIFWHNNIVGVRTRTARGPGADCKWDLAGKELKERAEASLIGTWVDHRINLEDGSMSQQEWTRLTDPWWQVEGRWFSTRRNANVLLAQKRPTVCISASAMRLA